MQCGIFCMSCRGSLTRSVWPWSRCPSVCPSVWRSAHLCITCVPGAGGAGSALRGWIHSPTGIVHAADKGPGPALCGGIHSLAGNVCSSHRCQGRRLHFQSRVISEHIDRRDAWAHPWMWSQNENKQISKTNNPMNWNGPSLFRTGIFLGYLNSWSKGISCTQGSFLLMLRRPCGMTGIKSGSAVHKANVLAPVLLLQPQWKTLFYPLDCNLDSLSFPKIS